MAWNYPLIDRLLVGQDRWLAEHPATERALATAWATAKPAGRRKLIAALLAQSQPAGLLLLIRRLHELDPASRDELVRRLDQLQSPLRRCLAGPDDSDTVAIGNALTLIAEGAAGDLAYLVVAKLRHTAPEVRAAAGACLRLLAQKAPAMEPGTAGRLAEAVNDAVARFAHHRHPAVLRAWLALAPRGFAAGGRAVEALQDAEHPAVGPIRELLQDADGPEVRNGLITALAWPTLALAAVAGLRACAAEGQLGPVIAGREHLLDLPAVRRGLSRVGDVAELLPVSPQPLPREPKATETEPACPAWAAWIEALPMPDLDRALRLGRFMASPDPATRLSALRRLLPLADRRRADDPRAVAESATHVQNASENDTDPAIARLAGAWLLARARTEPEGLSAVARSRHASIRTAAGRRLGATAFERMWAAWPRLGDRARLDAARAALRLDPTARTRLESQLRGGGAARQRAVEIVTLADQAGFLDMHPPDKSRNSRKAIDPTPKSIRVQAADHAPASASGDAA
ncbi:MAG: hypothetical protein AAF333_02885 [Planctomycetota bacterium]